MLPCSIGNAGPLTVFMNPLNRRRTSAVAVGLRASLPLKMTSSILSPRRLLALCSPLTHLCLCDRQLRAVGKRFEAIGFKTFQAHGTPNTDCGLRIADCGLWLDG